MKSLSIPVILIILFTFSFFVNSSQAQVLTTQGFSPFGIAITSDSKYAYLCFDLSEVVFKIRLSDLAVETVADLSDYFPLGSTAIALDASERKVFVHARAHRKLLVLDAQTMKVIHIIDDFDAPIRFFRSKYGSSLIFWFGGGIVKFVDTENYTVTNFSDNQMRIVAIRESNISRDKWYVVSGNPNEGWYKAGVYDWQKKTWDSAVDVPLQAVGETLTDLQVLPNAQKLYFGTFGGWYPDYHAFGWLYSVDLVEGTTKIIPIDGGASRIKASYDNRWIYSGTGWPIPNTNNIVQVDTKSDSIVAYVNLGQNKYGVAHTQINDLQIDPLNPRLLYATSSDGNAFMKIDLNDNILLNELIPNEETYRPHFFAKRSGEATGLILIHQSPYAFDLDLDKGEITAQVKLPSIPADIWAYDVAFDKNGRLFIAEGASVLEVRASDLHVTQSHLLPNEIGFQHFILSRDQTEMYTVTMAGSKVYPNNFLAVNTSNFQIDALINLEGGPFAFRPFELPNSSKLYVLGGEQNGTIVVHVIGTNPYTLQKTIKFNQPGLSGISAGPYFPFAYDPVSHTLFVGATQVVLAIDTDTDEIKKVIYLGDVGPAIGLEINQVLYINATGLVYHPIDNQLYITHLDRSFVSIYDLNENKFLPKIIPLKGYMPTYFFANDSYSKIYSLNIRSDNISVIDTKMKTVAKVIDLHNYSNTSVRTKVNSPMEFSLSQNYPNPFNPSTTVRYSVPHTGLVSVSIFNMAGQQVAILVNQVKHAGIYTLNYDGNNLSSGVYVCRLNYDGKILSSKMIILK
jgi:DNA-binding beta-propeller fold protein YncE